MSGCVARTVSGYFYDPTPIGETNSRLHGTNGSNAYRRHLNAAQRVRGSENRAGLNLTKGPLHLDSLPSKCSP